MNNHFSHQRERGGPWIYINLLSIVYGQQVRFVLLDRLERRERYIIYIYIFIEGERERRTMDIYINSLSIVYGQQVRLTLLDRLEGRERAIYVYI